MKLNPRTLLPLLGFAVSALTASAQHEAYITEAPVSFEITFGTHVRKAIDSNGVVVTKPVTSRLRTIEIIQQLINNGTIPSGAATDWQLVAVRPAPSDVYYVDGDFQLYAIKSDAKVAKTPIRIGTDVFSTSATFYSVKNYVERHQGRNIFSSRGTVTNYTQVSFTPTFVSSMLTERANVDGSRVTTETNARYTLDDLGTGGYATIRYETRTAEPIFYCAILSLSYRALGDFTGTEVTTVTTTTTPLGSTTPGVPVPENKPVAPGFGLVSMVINVGAPKLVRQSDYPEVPYF